MPVESALNKKLRKVREEIRDLEQVDLSEPPNSANIHNNGDGTYIFEDVLVPPMTYGFSVTKRLKELKKEEKNLQMRMRLSQCLIC